MMGEGSLRPFIEKMAKEYGLEEKVIFTGSIFNMAEMLQAMDIMVLPSRFEGLPNVVLEWQIACLPCVISDSITKECKLTDLVSYMPLQAGPAAWAEKIRSIEVVDREEKKNSILEQIRGAGFDIAENARQLKAIYYELLELRGSNGNG
jgi:glycosyltransferase involved in cell wall biosynthesis